MTPLRSLLLGFLALDYPYTHAELLLLVRSQPGGATVRAVDVRETIGSIAGGVGTRRLRRDESGAFVAGGVT